MPLFQQGAIPGSPKLTCVAISWIITTTVLEVPHAAVPGESVHYPSWADGMNKRCLPGSCRLRKEEPFITFSPCTTCLLGFHNDWKNWLCKIRCWEDIRTWNQELKLKIKWKSKSTKLHSNRLILMVVPFWTYPASTDLLQLYYNLCTES